MKYPYRLTLALILVIGLSSSAAADSLLEVYADSTMAGQPGFLVHSSEPGYATVTFFFVLENGQSRIFAVHGEETTDWNIIDPPLYFGPAAGAGIGDSWPTLPDDFGRSSHETFDGFENTTVPAGDFATAKTLIQPDLPTNYVPVSETRHFATGVGMIREYWPWEFGGDVLVDYHVSGGSGYLPLAVGNWWSYTYEEVSAVGGVLPPVNLLRGNFPNPFNPATDISFEMAVAGNVRLTVYDAAGRLVRSLLAGERAAGPHTVTWHGRDDAGRRVAAGVYLYRFEAGEAVQTRQMTLVK